MRMQKPRIVTHVMLVEGKDDLFVIGEIIDQHGIDKKFWIEDNEGITNIGDSLSLHLKKTETECIGVVVDADPDPGMRARWDAICGRLVADGYRSVPALPDPEGTVITQHGKPVVGVWMMPNNKVDGMLEDFVGLLVPDDDLMWAWSEQCLDKVPPSPQRFEDIHRSKAKIHTWLAWQKDPGTPMGLAIKKRYLDGTLPQGTAFAGWLRTLLAAGG